MILIIDIEFIESLVTFLGHFGHEVGAGHAGQYSGIYGLYRPLSDGYIGRFLGFIDVALVLLELFIIYIYINFFFFIKL